MYTSDHIYYHDSEPLTGFLALPDVDTKLRPAVLVAHDWSGRNDFACEQAVELAAMGYVGFALDMYGQGKTGTSLEEKQMLMQPLVDNRLFLQARVRAAVNAIIDLPTVDSTQIAAIGFCFGGLCVLDLARSSTKIKGVVSFHGLLNKPPNQSLVRINTQVLVLHGFNDPMVSSDQLLEFCNEMTAAEADWQVHQYGHTQHAFTNPKAHDANLGTMYNALAASRAWQATTYFLQTLFKQ